MFHKFYATPAVKVRNRTNNKNSGNSNVNNNIIVEQPLDTLSKRQKTAKACDRCRELRIDCDEQRPCSQCLETNTNFSVSHPARNQSSPQTVLSSDCSDHARRDLPSISPTDPSPHMSTSQKSPGVARTTANDVSKNQVDLASHVEGFFGTGQQAFDSSPNGEPHTEGAFPQLPHPVLPSENWTIASISLPVSERNHYLQLFWSDCHPFLQIVSEKDFAELSTLPPSTTNENYSAQHALVDSMIALGIQHSHTTRLSGRVLGLPQLYSVETPWPGFEYFSRSCECMRSSAEVTINALRCHVLLALYLMKGSAFRKAYNLVGITVRKAYIAKFHRIPPSHLPEAERTARVQLWWNLFSLDLCCSLQLDMPAASQKGLVKCPPPSEDALRRYVLSTSHRDPHRDVNSYTVHLVQLCVIIADISEGGSTADIVDDNEDINGPSSTHLEDHALLLSSALGNLEGWRDALPAELRWLPSEGDLDTARAAAFQNCCLLPVSIQRVAILLELQYHNTYTLVQRPFIRLRNIASNDSEAIESHINSSLRHATKIVNTIYTVCSTSDLLYGWSEILQPLWNAALTIMAYVYANSLSIMVPEALDSLSRAQTIFELFSSASTTAVSAKTTIESLTSGLLDMVANVSGAVTNNDLMSWDLFASLMEDRQKTPGEFGNVADQL
ncbi:Zn(II)2Cys6 transcription factor LALA0_S10e04236g [Lachancea lanzarotensis]|uniref:LALA0S10e04236g1_1 n=1 Tax=Lachancea lanzarotensis TaxID=1245769 RepID=A0A0C7N8G2_9SACH|nr:uncharacterized protein LALA0_S10e04236g [Lachancea lanzarotensis]CEP64180.1 LALA0S10e04236g1_1 [Lachancea lanzarotensis]